MVKRVGGLPTCVRSVAVGWWKDFNNVIDEGEGESVIYTDGVDDYISAIGWPYSSPSASVASPMLFNFKAIFNPAMVTGIHPIISIPKYITSFCVYLDNGDLYVRSYGAGGGSGYTYVQDIYTYPVDKYGVEVDITIAMSHVTSDPLVVSVDSTPLISTGTPAAMGYAGRPYIGYVPTGVIDGSEHYATGLSIWNIYEYIGYDGLGGTYAYISGIPGGTESSWQITDGSGTLVNPFTLYGNPSTISTGGTYRVQESIGVRTDTVYYGQYLDNTSGQINFYRTSGTFDYTDPSDGSLVEDVSIPGDGLYTIPANGICEIVTSDGSTYPICERVGGVLHDISTNETHISVATPSWSEELYGSDHLNQHGFLDKETSDSQGLDWETTVDGSPVTLDDDCLVPLRIT